MTETMTRLAEFMPYRISITSNAISDLIAREYRSRFGLKIAEWRVMAVLGDVGEATQRELVAATRMDKVAVNRATKALGERALIQRAPNMSDGRSHHLALTDTGRALYAEIMPLALQMETQVIQVLDPQEQAQFSRMLGKLLTQADSLAHD
ncbi:MAG: MarR family winged helix-turn-helix transcriptional regulator [Blastomonas fulva]|jgi:DNA-binding MarR family transcriptional regulator|uniref:MarR family transcriptional regulator n=1 Tax=Blastomonas fulva TaxID=1550728 RepID=A0ABM6M8Z8_9SPHN|nr:MULTISPECIES: MarR family winged helix-turn-helix transcriptional regulator [Blastomonas]ASR52414.1 MarR family transcriptional regulator [Blastomonas fulva]KPF77159.1 MarR family transcriptional regulator [Blastomonas sp. AAP25]MCO5793697.1 winged helix-turn-helix transcriptional regulator [Blastomonas sp.]MDK2758885.1 MarR family winged helix-turn-helix transcriptional regulator [Blastomonas fulva]MDM7929540.1 MarR family winged helix-turn-helix transcriptional regulator [Blastomonas fulv